jgi:hypothetical protein
LADVLRALRRGYSMEAERRIHDDFAAALGVVAEPPADTTDSAATDEDDVLLF